MQDTTYFELKDALAEEGCALCRLGQRAVSRYFYSMLFESINDLPVQEQLKASQGFCQTHGEFLLAQSNSLGTAILYRAILGHLAQGLGADSANTGGWIERLGRSSARSERLPSPAVPCPACQQRDESTARYLKPLTRLHQDTEMASTFAASAGFCVPHLRQAQTVLKGEALERLLALQRERWEELRAQLAELIRKNDYRYQHEKFGVERDSWLRAVRAVNGEPGVF